MCFLYRAPCVDDADCIIRWILTGWLLNSLLSGWFINTVIYDDASELLFLSHECA